MYYSTRVSVLQGDFFDQPLKLSNLGVFGLILVQKR